MYIVLYDFRCFVKINLAHIDVSIDKNLRSISLTFFVISIWGCAQQHVLQLPHTKNFCVNVLSYNDCWLKLISSQLLCKYQFQYLRTQIPTPHKTFYQNSSDSFHKFIHCRLLHTSLIPIVIITSNNVTHPKNLPPHESYRLTIQNHAIMSKCQIIII